MERLNGRVERPGSGGVIATPLLTAKEEVELYHVMACATVSTYMRDLLGAKAKNPFNNYVSELEAYNCIRRACPLYQGYLSLEDPPSLELLRKHSPVVLNIDEKDDHHPVTGFKGFTSGNSPEDLLVGGSRGGFIARLDYYILAGRSVRERFIVSNLGLVGSIAERYVDRGLPFDDLDQEGRIGLIKAVEKYDGNLGHKFSTYATWWIRQAITRAVANHSTVIDLPIHVRAALTILEQLENNPPSPRHPYTDEEIAAVLTNRIKDRKFNKWAVGELRRVRGMQPCSLDYPLGLEDESELLGNLVAGSLDTETEALKVTLENERRKRILAALKNILTEEERRVVILRYGLDDGGKGQSLSRIGELLGYSRETARRIAANALKQLRSSPLLAKEGLTDY